MRHWVTPTQQEIQTLNYIKPQSREQQKERYIIITTNNNLQL